MSNSARDLNTVVTDYAMFDAARQIREWLWQISGLIKRLNEDPNPFYGCTQDGLVLIEYYGGPSTVGTPLGKWACTGGGSCNRDWLEQARERLGLVLLMAEVRDENGCYGPVWGITKDLEGKELPAPVWTPLHVGISITSLGALNIQSLPTEDLRSALIAAGVRQLDREQPSDWSYPETWNEDMIYNDMRYYYSAHLWSKVKSQIKFVAWDDRVDPDWALHTLYAHSDRVEESAALEHAFCLLPERNGRFYSVRDLNGTRLLSVATHYVADDGTGSSGWACSNIVGYRNRHPTADELKLVEKLLAPRACNVVQYKEQHFNTNTGDSHDLS